MALILNIDTATETGSIALSSNGSILSLMINEDQKDHAAWIHNAIHEMMRDAGRTLKELNAVAVTAGPGSYTGLRVGMATAKGLCYALNIPLITENTLKVMAHAAVEALRGAGKGVDPVNEVVGATNKIADATNEPAGRITQATGATTQAANSILQATGPTTQTTGQTQSAGQTQTAETAPSSPQSNPNPSQTNSTPNSDSTNSSPTNSTPSSAQTNPTNPNPTPTLLCPMIDARRMEVFTAVYNTNLNEILKPQPMILDPESFSTLLGQNKIIFLGSGSDKFKILIQHPHASFTDIRHNAADLACLAQDNFMVRAFTNPAYAEPVYLKEFYTHTKK